MKKGDTVTYKVSSGYRVEARVLTVHKGGAVSIRALFTLNPDGSRRPGYLGYRYRVAATSVQEAQALLEDAHAGARVVYEGKDPAP
jgi:hypothetical protein